MEAISPVFAALGITGYDALDDLAHWLDGGFEPAIAENNGWAGSWGDPLRAAVNAAGREG